MKQAKWSACVLVSLVTAVMGGCLATPPEEEDAADAETLGESRDELLYCDRWAWCPPGYAADVHCSIICGSCPYGRYGSTPNATECIDTTPRGTLTAQPAQVPIATGSLGTTRICASSNIINSQVWVSMDGAPETLFASHYTNGCSNATWIQIGHSYQFTLYAGSGHTNQLATVTVTGVDAGPPVDPCDSCPGNTSCRCGDGVCRSPDQYCP
ncbi:hypothetical protein [Chondromyces crocatus]|nr:hypothetical protein [Chondromyces crocatus]